MAVFPATYFLVPTVRYPDSGTKILLSNSYEFTAGPTARDRRVFTVKLQGMAYFLDEAGALDLTVTPTRNMAVLTTFYELHKQFTAFDFAHPVYGTLSVKFNRPLEVPEGVANGNGLLNDCTVELVEMVS